MGWLAKVGATIAKVVGLATGFMPLLQGVLPAQSTQIQQVSDDLTKVAGMVTTVEAIAQAMTTPAPGAEKLKMATPLVAQVILQADFMVGHKIKDQQKFQSGAAQIASGMADVLSSLEG